MMREAVDLPEWVREPVLLSLADLQEPGTADIVVEWRPESEDAGVLVVGEPASASQRFERDAAVPANLLVAIATWLQDQFFPDPAVRRADARPACPGHDHPMKPKSLYDVPWWSCPDSGSPIRVIGEA